MTRLRHYEDWRFVGARDSMRVYDTDDDRESQGLAERIDSDALWQRNLISTFAPDTLAEARNRGFRPI